MKNLKKLLPLFAFVLGLGLVFTQSAFKTEEVKSTNTTEYYWYSEDGEEPLGHDVEPEGAGCSFIGEGCAKGYETEQTLPATAPTDITRGFN